MKIKNRISLLLSIFLCLSLFTACGGGTKPSNSDSDSSAANISGDTAVIDIKDYGIIEIKLEKQAAPITVENFINLANSGFYNGLTFHRIM